VKIKTLLEKYLRFKEILGHFCVKKLCTYVPLNITLAFQRQTAQQITMVAGESWDVFTKRVLIKKY